jgi:hypothetical protein
MSNENFVRPAAAGRTYVNIQSGRRNLLASRDFGIWRGTRMREQWLTFGVLPSALNAARSLLT